MIVRLIGLFLFLQGLVACDSEIEIDITNPANLEVEVDVADDATGIVDVLASADNAVNYELWVEGIDELVDESVDGVLSYTFTAQGNFKIDVRAYGSSGRYIKESKTVFINFETNVSVGEGYTTPIEYDGYTLIWNDEFETNSVNTNKWVFETGNGCPNLCGWGNNELQYYRAENAWVGDDVLTIEAREEAYQGRSYTSTRMKTQGKFSFKYGRVDIRALLPRGQGIWPALWMLGNSITSVGWPACGEIDIMEMIGGNGRENTVHGTVHWDSNGHAYTGGGYTLSSGNFANEYHVFSIIWDETYIKWYVNDVKFYEVNITPNHMAEFHQPHFFIFNIAVGGYWPGSPDATTVFPQQMRVDYIRVFQVE
ncbi:glycoside hydrolase family 16 protein [Perlabentimonas gracilis]|uniref:glycoside hydrolase family 16 protein n=1 Tax=Perlabentimonas gracilis TaxID=2715279 RepID=UPI00140A0045|nr:glycoside hydrolase family 16 protein [Perlabentimonas gracilis]NHB68102.1 glycoside hydrolase family 16 protein [Perlabentimonas gracilis]